LPDPSTVSPHITFAWRVRTLALPASSISIAGAAELQPRPRPGQQQLGETGADGDLPAPVIDLTRAIPARRATTVAIAPGAKFAATTLLLLSPRTPTPLEPLMTSTIAKFTVSNTGANAHAGYAGLCGNAIEVGRRPMPGQKLGDLLRQIIRDVGE
jgi:hypothetical protein